MRIGDEQLLDPVVFFGGRGLLAATAAFLRAVFGQRLAFDVAAVGERDHHVGWGDQVFGGQVLCVVLNMAAARAEFALAELLADGGEFFNDDG